MGARKAGVGTRVTRAASSRGAEGRHGQGPEGTWAGVGLGVAVQRCTESSDFACVWHHVRTEKKLATSTHSYRAENWASGAALGLCKDVYGGFPPMRSAAALGHRFVRKTSHASLSRPWLCRRWCCRGRLAWISRRSP